jgi:hypothetical protein
MRIALGQCQVDAMSRAENTQGKVAQSFRSGDGDGLLDDVPGFFLYRNAVLRCARNRA